MAAQFHLALPCVSISKTRAFYNELLGAQIGRSSVKWIDVNLYNHQITFTECGPFSFDSKSYAFNGHILPSFHFGVILDKPNWDKVLKLLKSKNVENLTEVKFLENKTVIQIANEMKLTDNTINELCAYFKFKTSLDLFFAVGSGELTNTNIKEFVANKNSWYQYLKSKIYRKSTKSLELKEDVKYDTLVFGSTEEKLEFSFAKCCSPIPGDQVFGFTTIREGIKIHRHEARSTKFDNLLEDEIK